MFANHPDIARRWAAEYPSQGKLPQRVAEPRAKVASALMARRPTPKY